MRVSIAPTACNVLDTIRRRPMRRPSWASKSPEPSSRWAKVSSTARADGISAIKSARYVPGGGYAEYLHDARLVLPSHSARPVDARGGESARELFHGLEQRIRSRAPCRRRDHTDSRRVQRHRADRDTTRARIRRSRDHDGGQFRQGEILHAVSARTTRSTIASRILSQKSPPSRPSVVSTSFSTWSAATTSKKI